MLDIKYYCCKFIGNELLLTPKILKPSYVIYNKKGGEIGKMNKKLLSKMSVIGLVVLFVVAAFGSSVSSMSMEKGVLPLGRSWSDDFEGYAVGHFLDNASDPADGGWKGWDGDPAAGAYVVDTEAYDGVKSVEIVDAVDLVHEYTGYTAGKWTYTAYQYIPVDFSGNSYFILLSDYLDGAGQENKWAIQLRFDSLNQIVESEHDVLNLPLITGQWVDLVTLIDLDADLFKLYYGGQLLIEKAWTAGPNNDGLGILNIAAVDLFANAATEVYYDGMSLSEGWPSFPDLICAGELRSEDVVPGATVSGSFTVENAGDSGSELDWEVTEYPDWGSDWTFTPASGTGLTPEAGPVTVDVSFVAPPDSETEFFGDIKVVNSNDVSDFCRIDVYVLTPRSKTVNFPLFYRIFERFPNAFPVLRQLLGL